MSKTKTIIPEEMDTDASVFQGRTSGAQTAAPVLVSTEAIRPFTVRFSEADLKDLRQRILATKWPNKEHVADISQGVQLETMKKLADYWANNYDWRKVEARLNSLPQFITNIDGLDIHFIHVRSKHPNALPVIVTHGWPGSIIEQLKIIDPFTDPTAHGGKVEDAFDIIIPSLPGYGFSAEPAAAGWNPLRIAKAWIELMKRLGYNRYVAQGGDWGNLISEIMGIIAPPELLGMHTNLPATVPPEISMAAASGAIVPAGFSDDEKNAYQQLEFFFRKGLGYFNEMGLRPQTLYGIGDSPIGLASWILDHDARSLELINRVFNGENEGLTRDDILDNITLYWLTNTGIPSARLYWEAFQVAKGGLLDPRHVNIPVAVTSFPDELYSAPKSWTEKAYSKLIYFNKVDKGGHFAAWEQPKIFTEEVRAAFKTLR